MNPRIALKLRLWRDDDVAMGPGKADLLAAIGHSGSISGAARSMDMSYRRAWILVDVMNRSFREPLVLQPEPVPEWPVPGLAQLESRPRLLPGLAPAPLAGPCPSRVSPGVG